MPGTAAPISIAFSGTAGSTCGALLPTGRVVDTVDGVDVTCIDNGMPAVLLAAADLGVTGYESPADLEADTDLADRLEHIRSQAGKLMGLGECRTTTVPKMTLVAAPLGDGAVDTRTFIPVPVPHLHRRARSAHRRHRGPDPRIGRAIDSAVTATTASSASSTPPGTSTSTST